MGMGLNGRGLVDFGFFQVLGLVGWLGCWGLYVLWGFLGFWFCIGLDLDWIGVGLDWRVLFGFSCVLEGGFCLVLVRLWNTNQS